jgi:hypothetical protein
MSEKIIYRCDKCGTEMNDKKEMYDVEIIIKNKHSGLKYTSDGYSHIKKDYCVKCWKAIAEVL